MFNAKQIIFLFVTLMVFGFVDPKTSNADDSLIFGVYPFQPASKLHKIFFPLTNYLSKEIGVPIRIHIARDYQAHIDNVGGNKVDISYMGPAPYVKMVNTYGPKPLLARLEINGQGTFQGAIIVRDDSPLQSLADLKNKRFAFGDPDSTMSHLVPRFSLWQAGVDAKDLSSFSHVSNHSNVALGVLTKQFDAGAVKESVYKKYQNRGLRVLAMTPPIPVHLFVASSALTPELVNKLCVAMYRLNEIPEGKDIMQMIKPTVTGLAPVTNNEYEPLRNILRKLNELGVGK